MKVYELIEELRQFNGEADVVFIAEYEGRTWHPIISSIGPPKTTERVEIYQP